VWACVLDVATTAVRMVKLVMMRPHPPWAYRRGKTGRYADHGADGGGCIGASDLESARDITHLFCVLRFNRARSYLASSFRPASAPRKAARAHFLETAGGCECVGGAGIGDDQAVPQYAWT